MPDEPSGLQDLRGMANARLREVQSWEVYTGTPRYSGSVRGSPLQSPSSSGGYLAGNPVSPRVSPPIDEIGRRDEWTA